MICHSYMNAFEFFFWITFDRNKNENCSFHPWREEVNTDRMVYCEFSNMISEVLLCNFLMVGKSFFTKKRKMKKRFLEEDRFLKGQLKTIRKKQVNIVILTKLYLSHEELLRRVVRCYNNGYLTWKTVQEKKWSTFLVAKNHGSRKNYLIFLALP